MTEKSYYQDGASESGNSDVSSQTTSQPESLPIGSVVELNGNEPITRSELRSVLKELEDNVLRKAQSHTDKLGSSLDKRIKSAQDEAAKAINVLKASGVSLTPEQERVINRTAVDQALAVRDDPPSVPEQNNPQKIQGAQESMTESGNNLVSTEVHRIMKDTGVYLPPDEANELIGEVRSPYEYIRKFEEICTQRSNKPQPQAEQRIPTLAPTTGKAATIDVLKRQYDEEIAQITKGKHPTIQRGEIYKITKLKDEYRKKGLPVY